MSKKMRLKRIRTLASNHPKVISGEVTQKSMARRMRRTLGRKHGR